MKKLIPRRYYLVRIVLDSTFFMGIRELRAFAHFSLPLTPPSSLPLTPPSSVVSGYSQGTWSQMFKIIAVLSH